MAIISYSELRSLRARHPGKKIVFCSGSFDLFHAGHVLFLEDCKNLGDILVVAVGPDKDIRKNKGPDHPILNEHIRLKIIDSSRPVNYSLISHSTRLDAHWLSPIEEIFRYFKPDSWIVNNDVGDMERRKILASTYGIHLVILDRVAPPEYEGVSTTSIIKKIHDLKQ